jgi:hypothetical protein
MSVFEAWTRKIKIAVRCAARALRNGVNMALLTEDGSALQRSINMALLTEGRTTNHRLTSSDVPVTRPALNHTQ